MGRLIDADKLREYVLDLPNCPDGYSDTYDKASILDLIDEQPRVEPVERGHWVDNGVPTRRRWCSVCGGLAPEQYDDYGLAEVTETDYCPWCGARMDDGLIEVLTPAGSIYMTLEEIMDSTD